MKKKVHMFSVDLCCFDEVTKVIVLSVRLSIPNVNVYYSETI